MCSKKELLNGLTAWEENEVYNSIMPGDEIIVNGKIWLVIEKTPKMYSDEYNNEELRKTIVCIRVSDNKYKLDNDATHFSKMLNALRFEDKSINVCSQDTLSLIDRSILSQINQKCFLGTIDPYNKQNIFALNKGKVYSTLYKGKREHILLQMTITKFSKIKYCTRSDIWFLNKRFRKHV